MQEIKLSIIVPVYNVEKYLGQCLDSLLNQDIDKNEYEIICINDGSRDSSGAILDDYAERYSNIVVVHKENAGVSAARNEALDMARGDYVHFVDSDDYFYPRVYGQLIDLLIREDADVLLFDYEKVGADCFYNESDFPGEKEISEAMPHPGIEISSNVFRNMIRRSLLEAYSIRFSDGISYGEDSLFEDFVACFAKKVIQVNEKLYFYRQGVGVSIKNDERANTKRMLSGYQVALELRELKKRISGKEKIKFLRRRISTNVAYACINSLRCQKGVAKRIRRQMGKDKLYPYAAAPLFSKLKRDKHNIILILLKYRLLFWLCDVCNVFRK